MPVNKKVKSKKSVSTIKKSVKKIINKNSNKKSNLAKNSIKKVVAKKLISAKYYVSETPLKYADREIFGAIKREYKREFSGLELIASENIVSRAVMEAQGSIFTNKYAEDAPKRML